MNQAVPGALSLAGAELWRSASVLGSVRVHAALLLLGLLARGQSSRPQSRPGPESRITALFRELTTAAPERATAVRRELLLFGPVVLPDLLVALRNNTPEGIRALSSSTRETERRELLAIFEALGQSAAPAIPELLAMMAAETPIRTRVAGEALQRIGRACVPEVRRALRTESDAVVGQLAQVVARLGATEALPELRECLAEVRGIPRVEVIAALFTLGKDSRRCVEMWIECLRDAGVHPLTPSASSRSDTTVGRAIGHLAAHPEVALPALIRALGDDDARLRCHAALALGEMEGKAAPAVAELRRGLLQEDATGRLARVLALARIGAGAASAAPELLRLLRQHDHEPAFYNAVVRALVAGGAGILRWVVPLCDDWDPEVRRRAVLLVGMLGPAAASAVPAMIERLADHNPSVAMAAAATLGRLGPAARDAVVPLLRDERARRRELAALALKAQGVEASAAAPELAIGLADPAEDARRACFAALAAMSPAGLPHLVQALTHPEAEVRRLAARTLGGLGPAAAAAVEALAGVVDHAEDAAAPDAAWALGRLGPLPAPVVARLQRALGGDGQELRCRALQALVQCGALASIPVASMAAAAEALRHPDPQVRLAALQVLRAAGASARETLAGILAAAGDADPEVQREAVSWLGDFAAGEPEALLSLCAALGSGDRYVRFRALAALSRDPQATRAALARTVDDGQSTERQRALARTGLDALTEKGPGRK